MKGSKIRNNILTLSILQFSCRDSPLCLMTNQGCVENLKNRCEIYVRHTCEAGIDTNGGATGYQGHFIIYKSFKDEKLEATPCAEEAQRYGLETEENNRSIDYQEMASSGPIQQFTFDESHIEQGEYVSKFDIFLLSNEGKREVTLKYPIPNDLSIVDGEMEIPLKCQKIYSGTIDEDYGRS